MLSFKNLTAGFEKNILENVSGELSNGSVTFLIGPNGSGKTSLLKTLSQIIPAKSGIISTQDNPIYLSSDFHFQSGLTGNDLIELYTSNGATWFDKELLDYLEVKSLVDLPMDHLSSGERQRLLICAILSNKSNIVFLDEPLNHLDWNFSLKIKTIIQNQSKRGRSFLISNHDLNWSLNFSNTQTWVLFQKSIFLKNSTESVLNDIKLQQVFRIKTEIISSEGRKMISLSEL